MEHYSKNDHILSWNTAYEKPSANGADQICFAKRLLNDLTTEMELTGIVTVFLCQYSALTFILGTNLSIVPSVCNKYASIHLQSLLDRQHLIE